MERIDRYETLARLASAQLRPGVRANVIVSEAEFAPAIEAGALTAAVTPAGLLLCRDRGDHSRLQFCLHDLSVPLGAELPAPVVTEVAFRPQDTGLRETVDYLKSQGFVPLLERVHMTRKRGPGEPPALPLSQPGAEDGPLVLSFLRGAFSALTGCLPTLEELRADIRQGHVLLLEDDAGIAGCIHFSFDGRAGEIRHMAVREELRGRGLTRPLLAGFLEAVGGARCSVWARADYASAQTAYAHAGFAPDGRRSVVLGRE